MSAQVTGRSGRQVLPYPLLATLEATGQGKRLGKLYNRREEPPRVRIPYTDSPASWL